MGNKRALLVGINYPNTKHKLRGCINDVSLTSEMLTRKFNFQPKHKRMLTDASATTKNILERLEWLVDGAQPGDVLYFHYSGHGSQMVDTRYDDDVEPDGLDEIICPIDLNWRDKVIKDDDFKRIFNKVPAGVNLTVMLDCCHSGSGIDSFSDYQPMGRASREFAPDSPNRSRLLEMPADIANRSLGLDLSPRPRGVQSGNVKKSSGLLISGCQSHQTSADAFIHNKYIGAATYFLLDSLKKNNYNIGYKELVERMNAKLAKYRYAQRPELNGNEDLFTMGFLQPIK
jgi:hypothetical protein